MLKNTEEIFIKITPNAKEASIEEIFEEEAPLLFENKEPKRRKFKVKVKSIPEDGKANKELIEIISKYFKLPKKNIEIIKGLISREKIVKLKKD